MLPYPLSLFCMRAANHFKSNRWFYALILASILLFYWYEVRPIRVYRQCAIEASNDARALLKSKSAIAAGDKAEQYNSLIARNMYLRSDYESFLQKCLLFHGLPELDLSPDDETGVDTE